MSSNIEMQVNRLERIAMIKIKRRIALNWAQRYFYVIRSNKMYWIIVSKSVISDIRKKGLQVACLET